MAHGQGATSNKRGGYGAFGRGTRGHGKDKSVKKAEQRDRDPRYKAAMEETRQHQEALDALIEEQKLNPAVGEVEGAMHAARLREKEAALAAAQKAEKEAALAAAKKAVAKKAPAKKAAAKKAAAKKAPSEGAALTIPKGYDTSKLKQESDDKGAYSLTTAKMMLKAGYHIKYVIEATGIGYEELKDIEIDDDGYGVTEEQKCSVCGRGIKTS